MALTQQEIDEVTQEVLASLNNLEVTPVASPVERLVTATTISGLQKSLAIVPSKSTIATTTFDSSINAFVVRDDANGGKGQARWKRISTPGTVYSNWMQQSADGTWWQLSELEVNPYQFGAVGDASTDDTTALNAMCSYANWLAEKTSDPFYTGLRPTVVFGQAAGWNTTTGITLEMGVNLVMRSPLRIVASASAAKVGIQGQDTYAASNANKGVRWGKWRGIWVIRVTQSDWSASGDIGVNISTSPYVFDYEAKIVSGFRTGQKITGSYHKIELGEVFGAKYCANLEVSGSSEFSNHLRITSQEFGCGGINAGQSRYGITFKGNAASGMNCVHYSGGSFELALSTAQTGNPSAEVRAIVFDGSDGTVQDIYCTGLRSEGNGGVLVKTLGTVVNTVVEWLHAEDPATYPDTAMLDDQATITANNLVRRMTSNANAYKDVWNSGDLVGNSVGWSNNVAVRGLEAIVDNGAGVAPTIREYTSGGWNDFSVAGYLVSYGGSVGSSQSVGRRISLNGERNLAVKASKQSSSVWPIYILCWDASGTQITAANKVYLGYAPFPTSSIYNGCYTGGLFVANATSYDASILSFASDVATVGIYLKAPAKSFGFSTPRGLASSFAITDKYGSDFFANAIPTTVTGLTYQTGQVAKAIAPAAGSPIGWARTSSSWVALANL